MRSALSFLLSIFLSTTICFAQEAEAFDDKVQAVKAGQISVADLVSFIRAEAEANNVDRAPLERAMNEVTDLSVGLVGGLDREVEIFLSSHATADAKGLKVLVESLLRREPTEALKSKRLFELAEKADALAEAGKDKELQDLGNTLNSSSERAILASRLSKVNSGIVQEITDSDEPQQALKKLAAKQSTLSSSAVADSVEKILLRIEQSQKQGAIPNELWPFLGTDVLTLLRFASQTRPSLKLVLAGICEQHLASLMESESAKGLDQTYSLLLENRPDPNPKNDQLRLRLVLDAQSDGARDFALGRLEELRYSGSLSLLNKLRVMLKGYYGRGAAVFFIASVVIILVGAILMFIKPIFVAGVTEALMSAEKRSAESKTKQGRTRVRDTSTQKKTTRLTRPSFTREKYVPGYMRGPVEDDEYTRILRYFDLEDGATESQIKKAYRDKVKSLHPDAKPGEVHTESEEFIELKEVYDRLLQIRSSMFGSK